MRARMLLALLLSTLSTPLLAAPSLMPSVSLYHYTERGKSNIDPTVEGSGQRKTRETSTFVNLGVCYMISEVCLGLRYLQAEIEQKTSGPGYSAKSTFKYKGPGLTVGYAMPDGLVAMLSVLINGKKEVGGGDLSYRMKSGYIAELGYGFKAGNVNIGPLLGYYRFEYDKYDHNGQGQKLKPVEGNEYLLPQLALWVHI